MMRLIFLVCFRVIVVTVICSIFLPPDRLDPDHVMHTMLGTFAGLAWAVGDWLFWEERTK